MLQNYIKKTYIGVLRGIFLGILLYHNPEIVLYFNYFFVPSLDVALLHPSIIEPRPLKVYISVPLQTLPSLSDCCA